MPKHKKFILDVQAVRPTVNITVTGRPDFMINVYSKATETPLKADSPRLGTTISSLVDPSG